MDLSTNNTPGQGEPSCAWRVVRGRWVPWLLVCGLLSYNMAGFAISWWHQKEEVASFFGSSGVRSIKVDRFSSVKYLEGGGPYKAYVFQCRDGTRGISVEEGRDVFMITSAVESGAVETVNIFRDGKEVVGLGKGEGGPYPCSLWMSPRRGPWIGECLLDVDMDGTYDYRLGPKGNFKWEGEKGWGLTEAQ
jgi:hypothetical protein